MITGWIGVFFLPFIGVMGILGIFYGILFLREKKKIKNKIEFSQFLSEEENI